jgi:hypothetical protein
VKVFDLMMFKMHEIKCTGHSMIAMYFKQAVTKIALQGDILIAKRKIKEKITDDAPSVCWCVVDD